MKKFIVLVLAVMFFLSENIGLADVVISNDGSVYNGKIIYMSRNTINITTKEGIVHLHKSNISEIKFEDNEYDSKTNEKKDDLKSKKNTTPIKETNNTEQEKTLSTNDTPKSNQNSTVGTQCNKLQELFTNEWLGYLISPDNNTLDLNLKYNESADLIITVADNSFTAQKVYLHPDNTIKFFILPDNNTKSKLVFEGTLKGDKISGTAIDTESQKGTWEVSKINTVNESKEDSSKTMLNDKKNTNVVTPNNNTTKPEKLIVPNGLELKISFKHKIRSNEVQDGDLIPIKVVKNVYVGDTLVFKQNSEGIAEIESSKHSGSLGRGGKIIIEKGKIYDVFGNEHAVNIRTTRKGKSKPSAIIMPVVGLAVLWPLAFFALRKGNEATISDSVIFNAITTSETTININNMPTRH